MRKKTTHEDFEYFQKVASDLINILGLQCWHVKFTHQKDPDNVAYCSSDLEAMSATLCLGIDWEEPVTTELVRDAARHEVFELFFAEMNHLSKMRYVNEKQIDSARHRIIQTLLNVM
jgi:hypothetical protein